MDQNLCKMPGVVIIPCCTNEKTGTKNSESRFSKLVRQGNFSLKKSIGWFLYQRITWYMMFPIVFPITLFFYYSQVEIEVT